MKKLAIVFVAACALSMGAYAKNGSSGGTHAVSGHTTKNGTYVAPTRATNPNATRTDNYSQKGNVNPYSGTQGAKN